MPSSAAASQLRSMSSTNRHLLGGDAVAEPLERDLVDLGVGLAAADEGGVDDELEDLVDGSIDRQTGSHSRTLLVSSAIRSRGP